MLQTSDISLTGWNSSQDIFLDNVKRLIIQIRCIPAVFVQRLTVQGTLFFQLGTLMDTNVSFGVRIDYMYQIPRMSVQF